MSKVVKLIQRLYRESRPADIAIRASRYVEKYALLVRELEKEIGDIEGKDILDFGCGHRFPLSRLFTADGVNVTGIDPNVNDKRKWRSQKERVLYHFKKRFIHKRFLNTLAQAAHKPDLLSLKPNIVQGDGMNMGDFEK